MCWRNVLLNECNVRTFNLFHSFQSRLTALGIQYMYECTVVQAGYSNSSSRTRRGHQFAGPSTIMSAGNEDRMAYA